MKLAASRSETMPGFGTAGTATPVPAGLISKGRGLPVPDPLTAPVSRPTAGTKRILVAWFRFTVNGGIGRFLNVARVLNGFGHEVAFTSLTNEIHHAWPDFPGRVLTFDEAWQQRWDSVMVPGAGAPTARLALLSCLRDERFGVRIQHVLNDPSLRDSFEVANRALLPDVVIFNNSHWQSRDFRRWAGAAFHILPGGVDTDLFYPFPSQVAPIPRRSWSVGGFATKNPRPLLEAVPLLPADHVLFLYGVLPPEVRDLALQLQQAGRLRLYGPLFGSDLATFYRQMDMVVTTETRAGWCNCAAEAMACGIPCVVTRHGTIDFARHEENALVVEEISAEAIATAIDRLATDAELRVRLAQAAAVDLGAFSWASYSRNLLTLIEPPAINSYSRIPELGLYGKWDPATRIEGLQPILADCGGSSLLDLGAAEGIIAHEFARRGAGPVHGFELDTSRVDFARRLFAKTGQMDAEFRTADLSDWSDLSNRNEDLLLDAYDIVLFLGLYHHLPAATRDASLKGALAKARRWFVIRTPETFQRENDLIGTITARGFELVAEHKGHQSENRGWLGVFRRIRA